MKTIITLATFLLLAFLQVCPAQKNVVKGFAFAIPSEEIANPYFISIGYERIFAQPWSFQVALERYRHGFQQWFEDEAISESYNSVVPEVRRYFGSKAVNNAWFFGLFSEISYSEKEFDENQSAMYFEVLTRNYIRFNPGLTIGKCFRLSNRWHVEVFAGVKENIKLEISEEVLISTGEVYDNSTFHLGSLGVRGGVYIGYRW